MCHIEHEKVQHVAWHNVDHQVPKGCLKKVKMAGLRTITWGPRDPRGFCARRVMGYMGGAGPAFARRLPLTVGVILNKFLNPSPSLPK